ncbi:MAG: alpha-2-macroglobulin family protein [Acidobacteriota bacterium]|nr:alpha-2-macroglobulin family protein [Acidobacteriota bacterium]
MKLLASSLILSLIYTMIIPYHIFAEQNPQEKKSEGLKLTLSETTEKQAEKRERSRIAEEKPLSDSEINSLFQRLNEIEQADTEEFVLRPQTLPPPKSGNIILSSFPYDRNDSPPISTDISSDAPLKVLRYSPEGEVSIASDISVTFSEPMIAITSQEKASEKLPINVSPPLPEGQWRWLGTRTLIFDAKNRLPMATEFTLKIPAGTESATGKSLDKDFTWKFSTSPPKITTAFPENTVTSRNTPILIAFDQKINPQQMLNYILVKAGTQTIPVRLATEKEIENEARIKDLIKGIPTDRYLVLQPLKKDGKTDDALPFNSEIRVEVLKGAPSAEGPLITKQTQGFSFRTFGPMRLTKRQCQDEKCSPFSSWIIQFTNPIDTQSFDPSMVKIEPQIEDVSIYPVSNQIIIQGFKKAKTNYKVLLSEQIKDIFGQNLDKPVETSFTVVSAEPSLFPHTKEFIVSDPFKAPTLSIYSINIPAIDVSFYRVSYEDWIQFCQTFNSPEKRLPSNKLIKTERINIKKLTDQVVETVIDLSSLLGQETGQIAVLAKPAVPTKGDQSILVWYQVTQIGIETITDNEDLFVRVSDLKTGKPLSGVEISIYPDNPPAIKAETKGFFSWLTTFIRNEKDNNITDESGMLKFQLPKKPISQPRIIIARRGKEVAILPEYAETCYLGYSSWQNNLQQNLELKWFVFDDRKIYRPGEEVNVKGYLRIQEKRKLTNISAPKEVEYIDYSVEDSQRNEIAKGTIRLNSFGAFDFKFKIPDNASTGQAIISLKASTLLEIGNSNTTQYFQIQEFRRPEFEVKTKVLSETPHILKNDILVLLEAQYYAGGGLPDAPVTWTANTIATNYTPPNRSDYIFGIWQPWWIPQKSSSTETVSFQGKTDHLGKHILKIQTEEALPARPFLIKVSGAVEDLNRQRWSSSTSFLLHPSSFYIGLKTNKTFIQKGETLTIEAIVTDIDGNFTTGQNAQIKAELYNWQFIKGKWQEVIIDEQVCNFVSSENPFKCNFKTQKSGRWQIKAKVFDEMERANETELNVWIAGGIIPQTTETLQKEEIKLIPDKKEYQIGEMAEILVISPIVNAKGFLTLSQNGIFKVEPISLEGPSTVLKIPIEETYLPNFHVQLNLSGISDEGEKGTKPVFAEGRINLSVSLKSRNLKVTVKPEQKNLSPGDSTKIHLEIRNHENKPLQNAEVAVVVVDESVLALTEYKIPNPLDIFYQEIISYLVGDDLRKHVILGKYDKNQKTLKMHSVESLSLEVFASIRSTGSGSESGYAMADALGTSPILVRTDFSPLALFAPSVTTDSNGKAEINIKLPDNLTRYRITAVAVDKSGKLYGIAEDTLTARKPLMVRPSAPRFMNFGDRIQFPVILQNQTDKDLKVNVAIRASNALINGVAGKSITVPANDRIEVRFPVSTVKAGSANFQIVAVSDKLADAAQLTLPVLTPATSESFATYGSSDKDETIVQPVRIPDNIYNQFGGLEITTSSTQLQELTDAFIYICEYPFESSESIASRMISIAALYDVLKAFKVEGMPDERKVKERFEKDIEILSSRQRSDGSFGLWKAQEERFRYPFVTVHVTHALMLARAKGYKVPNEMLKKALENIKSIEVSFDEWHKKYKKLGWTVSAYALYVRSLNQDADVAKAKSILKEAGIENLPFEAIGWILSVLSQNKKDAEEEAIKRYLMNKVAESSKTAHFVTEYEDGKWLIMHSNRRADAVILEALIKADPQNDLIQKLLRGLLEHRKKGRWSNIQENVFVLLALKKYFDTYESTSPDLVARLWLGDKLIDEQNFKGRISDSKHIRIPMSYFSQKATQITLQRKGQGRLYYRIGIKYAPSNLRLEPADYGFTVLRTYEAIDSPDDVRKMNDGTWLIKAGARVRVKLTMVASSKRYHVALVDYLPAGLEVLNPALAVTESLPNQQMDSATANFLGWWWKRNWFEHQNLRDDRVEVFSSLVWGGVFEYSYFARATTIGDFIVPPSRAEEIYSPETFGRSGTDTVKIVED